MEDVDMTPKTEAPVAKKIEKATQKVTENVTAQVTEAVKATTEAVKNTTEAATSRFKDVQAQVKTAAGKAGEIARSVAGVQRSAIETVVKAGQIYGEGLQGLATHAVEVNRVQFEDTLAHFRALASVKGVKEALELQAKFARATASRALTEGSAFVEDYLKVTNEALAPVTTKVREAAEKVKPGV